MAQVLIPMDMPGTFRECDHNERDYDRNTKARVHPFMVPLITELSKKRPLWTFVSRKVGAHNHPSDPNAYFYAAYDVRVGDETIGQINRDVPWRDPTGSYEFDSRQLRAKRTRGTSNKTKDLKKAVKLIIENFHELSYTEHLAHGQQAVTSLLYKHLSNRKYAFSQAEIKARKYTMAFLANHWDEFMETVTDPVVHSEVSMLLERSHEVQAAEAMNATVSAGVTGAHVVLLGDKYIAKRAGSDSMNLYTSESLPDDLRTPVAALKLAGEGAVIEDIGVRGEGGSLFVIPTKVSDE